MSASSYLGPLGLNQYVESFDDEGYDDPTLLDDVTLDTLTNEMKMKKGHARKLMTFLKRKGIIKGNGGEEASSKVSSSRRYLDRRLLPIDRRMSPRMTTTISCDVYSFHRIYISNSQTYNFLLQTKKLSSRDYLADIGMERYAEAFDEEGYDEIDNLEGVDAGTLVSEIEGMKRGHAKKIERHVSKVMRERRDSEKAIEYDDEPNRMAVAKETHHAPALGIHQTVGAIQGTMNETAVAVAKVKPFMDAHPDLKWHGFMSHMQSEGGDAVMAIDMHLANRGWILWTDQSPNADVTLEGMKRGVAESAVYVLYATKSVFTRPFVRLELLTAIKLKKPILFIHEADPRRAKFTFDPKTGVPKDFQPITEELLRNHLAIPWERIPHLRNATVGHIENRIAETLTNSGVGLKTIELPESVLAAAEKCCMDDVTKSSSTTTTAAKTTLGRERRKSLSADSTWTGTDVDSEEPLVDRSMGGMLVTKVTKATGSRAKHQTASEGLYLATREIVNGKALYYHVDGRRYLYYTDTYKNWLCTTSRDMFSKGMGYLRTQSKNIATPSAGNRILEMYDDKAWVDSGAKVEALTVEQTTAHMRTLEQRDQLTKSMVGIEVKGIVGKGSRKSSQEACNGRYFADKSSWKQGRYNLYISERNEHFLFYSNKYENWVITNKASCLKQGMGFVRCNALHASHPGFLTWEIYDTAWEIASGAQSVPLPASVCDAAIKARDAARSDVKNTKSLTLTGFQSGYNGTYALESTLTLDGRPIYALPGNKFVYYSTVYNNWLVTNSRTNFEKGAGLYRTVGKNYDAKFPIGIGWEVYDYTAKKWVAASGVTVSSS